MSGIFGLLFLLVFGLAGLLVWTRSDLPMIQREIALNTRKQGEKGPTYSAVAVYCILLKILAIIIWTIGIAFMFVGTSFWDSLSYYF
jgi:hypothetical protein